MKDSAKHRLDIYAYLKKNRRWVSATELQRVFDPTIKGHDIKKRAREVIGRKHIDYPEKIDKKYERNGREKTVHYKLTK